MSDDKKISELISKSLRYRISQEESEQVEKHLAENKVSASFAELSTVIQNSVAFGASEASVSKVEAKLSTDAKSRMKDSVADAIKEKLKLSAAGLLDSPGTTMISPRPEPNLLENIQLVDDEREVNSRFKLIRKLGSGGLGNVSLARDQKLNRVVAIKELNPDSLESPKAWARFQREAEITGQLEHPNVVPLYLFGQDRNTGEPFYAMRFVGKRNLADAIIEFHDRVESGEDATMGLHRLLSVFLDICQAIAYAHSRGVIHRDLKPENVALDNFGQVIVLDWGLAKVLEDGELANKMTTQTMNTTDAAMSQTIDGDVVGTPLYMAPEQASGKLGRIDERTDVYGLGAILFAILTGQAPHENVIEGSSGDLGNVLTSIANGEMTKPTEICKSVPNDLEAICLKAMATKQHLRYESVQDLAESVERWMAGQRGKQSAYDLIRMECRELRADLLSTVRNLERNVRFMSELPPIQELIHAEGDETFVWRERLSTIFQGLLRATPTYMNVVYSKIEGDQFTEVVRVERQGRDTSNVRVVPKSRLRTDEVSQYIRALSEQKPGDVICSLVRDPMCERSMGCDKQVGLVVGVPVFNEKTEEVFGVVMIHCDLEQILREQLSRRSSASEVMVACDIFHIMMRSKNGVIDENSISRKVVDEAPHFLKALDVLQTELEFIDDTNSDVYGVRIWFIPNKHGVVYLLRR